MKEEAIEKGAVEFDDEYVENQKLIQLPLTLRRERAIDTIKALKNISGGAMQTNNMGDVTPKFIVLATTNTGNHPFSHIVKSRGDRDETVVLNIDGLCEVLNDYRDNFIGRVFIGKRAGFFDDDSDALSELQTKFKGLVVYGSVNEMIDEFCEQIKNQME